MVKRLKRKLKDIEIEITIAEPREYDTARGEDALKKNLILRKKGGGQKEKSE